MELNLTYHELHCRITIWYFYIDQVFNWVSIYLYLVIDNKILTNKLKINAQH
jgi:hypothetical protein